MAEINGVYFYAGLAIDQIWLTMDPNVAVFASNSWFSVGADGLFIFLVNFSPAMVLSLTS